MRSILRPISLVFLAVAASGQTVLHELVGDTSDDQLGIDVSPAGDVDGDGAPDFLASAYLDDLTGPNTGSVFVTSGRNGRILHVLSGYAANSKFGYSAAGVGDLNGDGLADVAVGAYAEGNGSPPFAGRVHVFSGADASNLYAFDGDSAWDYLGISVDGAGDVNGDGVPDVIAGASGWQARGQARVYSGADGSTLYTLVGNTLGENFGISVSGAGDVNADSYADFVVGAYTDSEGGHEAGSVRVFSGLDASVLHTFHGGPGDNLGYSVDGAGDLNHDGFDDLVAGAPGDDGGNQLAGKVLVYSGVDGSVLWTFPGESGERLGYSVAAAGDVDGDGTQDVIAGAPMAGGTDSGVARVYSGKDGRVIYDLDGDEAEGFFGYSVAGLGDINADGFGDIIIGAPQTDLDGNYKGRAQVWSGKPASIAMYCYCALGVCANTDPEAGCRNSTGKGGAIAASGSTSAATDDLVIDVRDLPAMQNGILFMGGAPMLLPFGDGERCVASGSAAICRYPVKNSGVAGMFGYGPGLVAYSQTLNAPCRIDPGETWYFQGWYRDPSGPCGSGFNLSNALSVMFTP